jgi:S-layer family protein
MKRIFSLVLVFAMVLGSFGTVFAADVDVATEDLKKVPTDVVGTEYEKAVSRLVAFDVLNGYKDGTYLPEQDVTRAEFAKILVEALGIGNAASAAQGKVTFPDVTASHWASGYINVASGQGLIEGFPNGNFQPNDQVTYAEALTMLVRALGYQDSFLKGEWPGSHIAKAAEAGITSGVSYSDARGFANRGKVAQMVNNTLDADVVKVETYKDGTVEYTESNVSLLKDKLEVSKYEDTRVIADKLVDDSLNEDEIRVKFLKEIKKDDKAVKNAYDEGDENEFTITKNVNPRLNIGEEVSVYMNDNDKVVYIETENDDKANFDYVEEVDGDELSLVKFDKDYKFDKNAVIYVHDEDDSYNISTGDLDSDEIEDLELAGRVGKFVVKNNRIVYAEVMGSLETYPWMLVLNNDEGLLEGINMTTEDFDIDLSDDGNYDGVFAFDTMGNVLDVEDIEEGNIVYVDKLDYDGDDYVKVVAVQDNMVEGELSKVKKDRVTIGNDTIKMVKFTENGTKTYDAYYSVEGFEQINKWVEDDQDRETDMEDSDEENMVAYLDAAGRIAFLSTEATGTSGFKYGVVTRTYYDNDKIKIYTHLEDNDGDEITYKVEEEKNLVNPIMLDKFGNEDGESTDNFGKESGDKKLQGRVVKFKLNKDGEIAEDEFYVMEKENVWVMEEDEDFGKSSLASSFQTTAGDDKSFAIDDRAVIIDAKHLDKTDGSYKDVDDFGIAKWSDMAEDNYNKDLEYYVFTKRNNDIDVDALVFVGDAGANTASDEEAIYVIDKWSKGGDDYVKYISYEDKKVEEREVDKGFKTDERAYIAKLKSDGKIELINKKEGSLNFGAGTVYSKSNNVITLEKDGKEYKLPSSALVYEEDTKKSTSNIRKGDAVYFVVENNVNIRVIERVVGSDAKDIKAGKDIYKLDLSIIKDGDNDNDNDDEKGTVTYINDDVKAGTDVVAKLTLPADNTTVYKVELFNNAGTSVKSVSTLVSKDVTASDLTMTTPGEVNATYVVRTYKVVDGNDVEISNKVVKNVDVKAPVLNTTNNLTDNKVEETATYDVDADGSGANITVTAAEAGLAGNGYKLALVDPLGNDKELSVVFDGVDTVTVNLATGNAGAITSTLKDVVDAVNANTFANQVVELSVDAADEAKTAVAVTADATGTAGGQDAVDAKFDLTFDSAMKADTTATVTIDGVEYNATVAWAGNVATLTITADQFAADDTLSGKTIEAISLTDAAGNAADISANNTL